MADGPPEPVTATARRLLASALQSGEHVIDAVPGRWPYVGGHPDHAPLEELVVITDRRVVVISAFSGLRAGLAGLVPEARVEWASLWAADVRTARVGPSHPGKWGQLRAVWDEFSNAGMGGAPDPGPRSVLTLDPAPEGARPGAASEAILMDAGDADRLVLTVRDVLARQPPRDDPERREASVTDRARLADAIHRDPARAPSPVARVWEVAIATVTLALALALGFVAC